MRKPLVPEPFCPSPVSYTHLDVYKRQAWETLTGGASPWTLKNKADWSSLDKVGAHEAPKRDYVERTLAPRCLLYTSRCV